MRGFIPDDPAPTHRFLDLIEQEWRKEIQRREEYLRPLWESWLAAGSPPNEEPILYTDWLTGKMLTAEEVAARRAQYEERL